jgi:hypothetical protein
MAKTATTAELSKITTQPSLEDLVREPSIDSLMTLARRLSHLTKTASVALANVHASNNRIDNGSDPALDAVTMSRLRAMATTLHDFSHAMRNILLIGVHSEDERRKILSEYVG